MHEKDKDKDKQAEAKRNFSAALSKFVETMKSHVSAENGQWTVKGFIDIYKNIYTISFDTKIVSKILEIHLFPQFLKFAEDNHYKIVLATHQNWYPDLNFIDENDDNIRFAVDIKTTYRDPDFPGHVNGFTLGSHGAYFINRDSMKNIQFPYNSYAGHYCLGIIYSRSMSENIDETKIMNIDELNEEKDKPKIIGHREVTEVKNLKSITSVIRDFQFFICEKWQLASDLQVSGNTANIGSITFIEDIIKGHGMFSKLGEDWFDEYWMNYGLATIKIKGKTAKIKRLDDFIRFKGGDKSLIVPMKTKKMDHN